MFPFTSGSVKNMTRAVCILYTDPKNNILRVYIHRVLQLFCVITVFRSPVPSECTSDGRVDEATDRTA